MIIDNYSLSNECGNNIDFTTRTHTHTEEWRVMERDTQGDAHKDKERGREEKGGRG